MKNTGKTTNAKKTASAPSDASHDEKPAAREKVAKKSAAKSVKAAESAATKAPTAKKTTTAKKTAAKASSSDDAPSKVPTAKKTTTAKKTAKSANAEVPPPARSSKAVSSLSKPAPKGRVPNAAPSVRRVAPPKPLPKPSAALPATKPAAAPAPAPAKPATVIPQPPRPPGPPLLREIQHLATPTPEKLTLHVGDKAVHPRHGVGEVIAIQAREIGGVKGEFYVMRILDDPTQKVLVPTNGTGNAGLRPIMSVVEADSVLDTMRAKEVAVNEHPWSRRFRAYTEMIHSGSPYEVAKVMRDMYRLKFDKDLSFGERRLLDQARSLLMKELALAKGLTEEALQADVAQMFES